MKNTMFRLTLSVAFLAGSTAGAAGFEKSIMFGGRSAGVAGIATPYTQGSEAVYFNPAGIVSDRVGQDATIYVQGGSLSSEGPFNDDNETVKSESGFTTPFGLFYNYTMDEKWGFGAGVYVSGGSTVEFKDLQYANFPETAEVSSDLKLFELALGAGYRVSENLKLGAAWRISHATAGFESFARAVPGVAGINAEIKDVTITDFTGFRFGAQYKLSEATSLGVMYRTSVGLSGDGKLGLTQMTAGGNTDLGEEDIEVATVFPQALTVGALHQLNEKWNIMGEWAWQNYSANNHITLDNKDGSNLDDIQQDWNDQNVLRLGAEYLGWAMPFRFGYAYVTQVTSSGYATLTSTAPGPGHQVTAGSEWAMNENILFTGALEYSLISGDGEGAAAGDGSSDFRAGEFTSTAYSLNLGMQYKF